MAPEVLCSENYAEPADVFRSVHFHSPETFARQERYTKQLSFSFGIILWEMLTKECPYVSSLQEILPSARGVNFLS
jgi:serine/threonine protein kinase